MKWLTWLAVALALIQGGWLTFDGSRALVAGDYTTPTEGAHAGELGPWAGLVSAAGLNPRGAFMKSVHVGLGIAWLVSVVMFRVQQRTGRGLMLGCSVATLWYLPVGTVLSLVLILILWLMGRGRAKPSAAG